MTKIRAWHFVGRTLRDGSSIPPDGVTLRCEGELRMCVFGLHASRDPFDALHYAPGTTLCLVECGGKIIEGTDKLVCSERTIIARMDVSELLRYYARMQALSVVHLWEPSDVVLDFLMTGRSAAYAAADAADAADAAADAAYAAAYAAADAAYAAADAAAYAAAADRARAEFNALVYESFEGVIP